ncbi:SRPBCC domain-containing protein [Pyxidicoccus xibeiensis]|uniref:SRPBCC domain-containing protein n=1 Tax=Pyxidicoccus xibeiensis TaxID=2906759 RepID=UPI0020A6DE85|nr:SRPBCC domain-containing protein [Pyxidicoccus xibeiensis]MCP3138741.1 SRPBCC domain-containing protein [Pyxidicoccus xibeiensis]
MTARQPGIADRARVTTFVAVEPDDAFEVFTQETDLWWKQGPRYRFGGARNGVLRFEGRAGGRLLEVFDDATGDAYEVGRVLVWEPGARLVFEWRARAFVPGEVTEVEVRFEPASGGTRVVLEHRGWDALAPTHPVRHGLEASEFIAWMGRWWGELATSYRLHAAKARGPS